MCETNLYGDDGTSPSNTSRQVLGHKSLVEITTGGAVPLSRVPGFGRADKLMPAR